MGHGLGRTAAGQRRAVVAIEAGLHLIAAQAARCWPPFRGRLRSAIFRGLRFVNFLASRASLQARAAAPTLTVGILSGQVGAVFACGPEFL